MKQKKILVLNGPNLDMLGTREPEVYGTDTLESLENDVVEYGEQRGVKVSCYQSNNEGKLIEKIHAALGKYDGIVYNPGAHTHYSYALRDAVGSIDVPVVEVHLSDISTREAFRRISVIAPACVAQVRGLGVNGYRCAIDILCENERHERLGEGFRVPAGESIVIGADLPSAESAPAPAKSFVAENAPASANGGAAENAPASANGGAAENAPAPANGGAAENAPAPAGASSALSALAASAGSLPVIPSGAPEGRAVEGSPRGEQSPAGSHGEDPAHRSFERQAAVQKACAQAGLAGLLARDTSNIYWLTAIDDVFDEERAHALLVAGGRAILHTDSRYSNAVRTQASRISSNVIVNDERMTHAQFAFDALSQQGAPAGKLGFEDSITYAEFVKMVDLFTTDRIAPTTDLVLGLRAVKDAGEIARLKAAQAITDAAFSHIIGFMRPGMTEREVQIELEDFMVRHGAEGLAFGSIVATGPNGADPHAIPGDTRLEAGQCVVMDFGAKACGYCSDMTRTVFLGAPEGVMLDAWETLRRANEQVEALLKPGVTGAEAHNLAEQVLEEGGYGGKMGHGLGHGVGIDVHELPVLNPRNDKPLVEGNVVTVEPGIYLPGEFGMRLEDFGVVTADGFDVFTQSTHETVII